MPLPKAPSAPASTLKNSNKEKEIKRVIDNKDNLSKQDKIKSIVKSVKTKIIEKSKITQTTQKALKKKSVKNIDLIKNRKLLVLDTNVLMHDPTSIFRFQEHDVFIPLVTLEELDEHKTGMTEVSRNVRQVTREMDALIKAAPESSSKNLTSGIPLNLIGHKDATGSLVFQTKALESEIDFGLSDIKPDNQILAVVQNLSAQFSKREVILVSKDINIRIKARALSLSAEDYFNDNVVDDDDVLYKGIKHLDNLFWEANGDNLESWQQGGDAFYRITGSIVQEMHINQFVFDEKERLSAIVDDKSEDCAVLKTLRDYSHRRNAVWSVTSRNPEQNFAFNLLMNPEIDFVTLLGQAGTGKTLLALAAGLAQTLETRLYNEIIVTRATVPLGEDIGFLPGTEEEKMIPWMGALEDNLEVLNQGVEGGGDWSRSAAVDLIRSRIKVKSLSFMRGRTFLNKFLIIDEAQNLTPKEMKALITRAGPGTKVICLGNVAQIDSPYLTESSSGLTYVVDRFKGWRHGGHILLQRGERSRLADFASEIL
tara:strand:+ start:10986 stop:12602 length:1617 start_codon:yes stop_codon:yes gene_type:complete